jgi:hypothetical protein
MSPDDKFDDDDINPDEILEDSRNDPLDTSIGDLPLDEDNDRPASDADDFTDEEDEPTDDTHPSTDSDVDATERYQQGL